MSAASAVPSSGLAVETRGLRKMYRGRGGSRVGVQGLDLAVPAGGVHGFLGPNGSGKTTTIRMLLGLIRADGGEMEIFGTPVPRGLPAVVDRVGAIVESPRFTPGFTGRRNLSLLAEAIGAERSAVDRVLEETGMRDRASDPFKGYSLGMKQRLAIAATLLKQPDLLIFDEPTNGLDPAGIREVRQTMRDLADQGRTVLVSSHILGEVQQVADTVSIVGRGTLLAQGRVDEVLSAGDTHQVRVGAPDPARAAQILEQAGARLSPPDPQHPGLVIVEGVDDPASLVQTLAQHGVWVTQLTPVRADLEQVFLDITRGESVGSHLSPKGGRAA